LSGRVVDGVGWLKARTTVPVVRILRAVVYGLIVVVAALTALVLAVLGVVRMWDVYMPVHPVGRRVWLGYVVLGAVLFLAGGALLVRRTAAKNRS
jgi:multisubunit Na+/H+ antiporter MnhG subunit